MIYIYNIYIYYTHILFELFVIIVKCPSFVSCFSLSGCLSLAISGMICSGCATQPIDLQDIGWFESISGFVERKICRKPVDFATD